MADLKKMLHVVASRTPDLPQLMANGERWVQHVRNAGLVRPGMRILDLGAGLGRTAIPLQRMGCTVHALDRRADMVQHLLSHGIQALQREAIVPADHPEPYDMVLALHVFQHQGREHVVQLLREIAAVSPRLLFTLPTVEAYRGKLPHDYVLREGSTERFADCETSFTYRESRVPVLLRDGGFGQGVRVPGPLKLWHAQR
jgi:SAM-dependent methyltransferase